MIRLFKKYVLKNKNNKFLYYAGGVLRDLYPRIFLPIGAVMEEAHQIKNQEYISKRLNYYNKLTIIQSLSDKAIHLSELKRPKRGTVYYFDTVEYTRYFDQTLKANFLFGDITYIPDEPSITKSRPIEGDNQNSVILKLNKVRHFNFIQDDIPFENKLNKLIWRGGVATYHKHRIDFIQMYFNHPLCNIGKTNRNGHYDETLKEWMSINEHLRYKFILTIEGNEVATNLKWVMSSNSVAVMPKPKFETWFMEGTLIPDHHYIHIKDDFSDLEDKLKYYLSHPLEAVQITKNANEYVRQFKDDKREDILSLLVLEKYFEKTGQLS